MAIAVRPIGHEDRLSLVDHLGELRARVLICAIGFSAAFAFALWQNHALLNIVNEPLEQTTTSASKHARGPLGAAARFDVELRESLKQTGSAFDRLSRSRAALSGPERAALIAASRANTTALRAVPEASNGRQPVTLGLGEPFTQTLTVAAYFALLFALPLILYQAYAFLMPAFTPRQRRLALRLMAAVPVLFIAGVVFGYFLVLPAAIGFLQNFNSGQFDVLVQAKTLYSFTLLTLMLMGVLFQMPVGVLGLTQLGVVTPQQLRRNWRYAVVVITFLALLLPGTDPVTTGIEMVPLLALYALSVAVASWVERRSTKASAG